MSDFRENRSCAAEKGPRHPHRSSGRSVDEVGRCACRRLASLSCQRRSMKSTVILIEFAEFCRAQCVKATLSGYELRTNTLQHSTLVWKLKWMSNVARWTDFFDFNILRSVSNCFILCIGFDRKTQFHNPTTDHVFILEAASLKSVAVAMCTTICASFWEELAKYRTCVGGLDTG